MDTDIDIDIDMDTDVDTDTDTDTDDDVVTPNKNIYRSRYRNYADPLTMFNASNYGRDPVTSAGYNYATTPGNMGIAQLNQNLRDFADRQMAQTYPDGSPRGADMDAVLAEMRRVGITATDLENARYGRTTGLNTPFSQYNKVAPNESMFGALLPQNFATPFSLPNFGKKTERTFGGGIAELIKSLPS